MGPGRMADCDSIRKIRDIYPRAQRSERASGELYFLLADDLLGIDVYNDSETDAMVTVSSPEIREVPFTIKPKQLQRLRTGWRDPSTAVTSSSRTDRGCALTI